MNLQTIAVVSLVVFFPLIFESNDLPLVDKAIDVRVDAIELSSFAGQTTAAMGVNRNKVPKIDRALVLTLTIEGTQNFEVPTVRLNNGKM